MVDYLYTETAYYGPKQCGANFVLHRKIEAGKAPATWKEFFGKATVELPGQGSADILFPFFGISTEMKPVLECVQECFAVYESRAQEAIKETLAEFEEHMKARAKATPRVATSVPATEGERHVDSEGKPAQPPAPKRRGIILP
jgi:hypothetical protein